MVGIWVILMGTMSANVGTVSLQTINSNYIGYGICRIREEVRLDYISLCYVPTGYVGGY